MVYDFSQTCMYVCLSVCQTITFKSLDIGSSFSHIPYISRSSSYTRVTRSRSRSREKKNHKYLFTQWSTFISTHQMAPQTKHGGWSGPRLKGKGKLVCILKSWKWTGDWNAWFNPSQCIVRLITYYQLTYKRTVYTICADLHPERFLCSSQQSQ